MEQQFDEVRIIIFWWDIVVSKKPISVESTFSTWQRIQHTACHFGANSFHCSLKRSLSLRAVWNFDCCCDFETEVWTLWVLSSLCAAGPSNWHLTYPSCGGSAQSPVNIDRSKVIFSGSLTTFDIPGYETIPRGAHWQLHNNGHTGQCWCITQCWIQDWPWNGLEFIETFKRSLNCFWKIRRRPWTVRNLAGANQTSDGIRLEVDSNRWNVYGWPKN